MRRQRASILLLFGMKVRGLCKRTVCTKIEVAWEDLCVCVCECREGGRRHVSCLRGGCVANTLPRGDLPWPLSARLWGRLLAPPGMQMSGHKTEADTATETLVEEKKGKWDQGENGGGGGGVEGGHHSYLSARMNLNAWRRWRGKYIYIYIFFSFSFLKTQIHIWWLRVLVEDFLYFSMC